MPSNLHTKFHLISSKSGMRLEVLIKLVKNLLQAFDGILEVLYLRVPIYGLS
jgi:hypothetical protein